MAKRVRVYRSKRVEMKFARTNVPEGYRAGPDVLYVVPEGKYYSMISKQDATQKAIHEAETNGPDYANEYGFLLPNVFFNDEMGGDFVKDDCEEGPTKNSVYHFVVPAGKFVSYISKEDANKKAFDYMQEQGQKEANEYGKCCRVYRSVFQKGIFYKNDCPVGYDCRDGIEFVLDNGYVTSTESREEANRMAYELLKMKGQEKANAECECIPVYYNDKTSGWFQKKCRKCYEAKSVVYTIHAGEVKSFVSKEDANRIAGELLIELGNAYAEQTTKCQRIGDFW